MEKRPTQMRGIIDLFGGKIFKERGLETAYSIDLLENLFNRARDIFKDPKTYASGSPYAFINLETDKAKTLLKKHQLKNFSNAVDLLEQARIWFKNGNNGANPILLTLGNEAIREGIVLDGNVDYVLSTFVIGLKNRDYSGQNITCTDIVPEYINQLKKMAIKKAQAKETADVRGTNIDIRDISMGIITGDFNPSPKIIKRAPLKP